MFSGIAAKLGYKDVCDVTPAAIALEVSHNSPQIENLLPFAFFT